MSLISSNSYWKWWHCTYTSVLSQNRGASTAVRHLCWKPGKALAELMSWNHLVCIRVWDVGGDYNYTKWGWNLEHMESGQYLTWKRFGVVDINPCIQTCLCHSHLYCSILDACNSTEICRVGRNHSMWDKRKDNPVQGGVPIKHQLKDETAYVYWILCDQPWNKLKLVWTCLRVENYFFCDSLGYGRKPEKGDERKMSSLRCRRYAHNQGCYSQCTNWQTWEFERGEWIYTVCNGRPHAWRLESI